MDINTDIKYKNKIMKDYEKQISIFIRTLGLDGLKLVRMGNLKFDHCHGACTQMRDEVIYLCFNNDYGTPETDVQTCRRSNGPLQTFSLIEDLSNDPHEAIHLGSSDSKLNIGIDGLRPCSETS